MSYSNKAAFVESIKERTKYLALESIKIFRQLPRNEEARIIGRQFLRSSTSVAANYRAACRARSKAEFFSKMSIVVKETDETLFWLELLRDPEILKTQKLSELEELTTELLKLFSSEEEYLRLTY